MDVYNSDNVDVDTAKDVDVYMSAYITSFDFSLLRPLMATLLCYPGTGIGRADDIL